MPVFSYITLNTVANNLYNFIYTVLRLSNVIYFLADNFTIFPCVVVRLHCSLQTYSVTQNLETLKFPEHVTVDN